MRVLAIILPVLLLVPLVSGAESLSKGQTLPELRLKNGTVLHHVKIVAVDPSSIMAKWDEGRGNIPAASLPDEIRRALPKSSATGDTKAGGKTAAAAIGRDPAKPPDPVPLRGEVGDERGPAQTITGQIVVTAQDGSLVKLAGVRIYAFGQKAFGDLNNKYYTQVNALFEYYQTMTHRRSAQHDFAAADVFLEKMESLFDQDLTYFPKGPRTESNAEGEFQLNHSFRGPFIVTARASRDVAGKTERYRWVINSSDIVGGRLLLSIDNLRK